MRRIRSVCQRHGDARDPLPRSSRGLPRWRASTMRLTAKTAAALTLPPGKKDHIAFDDRIPGFGIRLRQSGGRTWVFQYSLGIKQRRLTLGGVSAMPADKAREIAEGLYAKTIQGIDVAAEKALAVASAERSFGMV